MIEEKEITWEAPEFDYVEKDLKWYVIFGAIFFVIALFGWLENNFLFIVFIILSGILVTFLSSRKPENIRFKLEEDGFKIGSSNSYKYSDVTAFAVVERENKTNLLVFRRKTVVNPYLKLPLVKNMTAEVKDFLGSKLKEGEYEETLVDTLIDWIGL